MGLTDPEPMLANIHPLLVERIGRVLDAMGILGYPMKIVQGLRTVAQQQALYAKGRTEPGPIVTNADGVRIPSFHQARTDGLGHAVDCAFVGPEPFAEHWPWHVYGACVKVVGLTWGGEFKARPGFPAGPDRPHAELHLAQLSQKSSTLLA